MAAQQPMQPEESLPWVLKGSALKLVVAAPVQTAVPTIVDESLPLDETVSTVAAIGISMEFPDGAATDSDLTTTFDLAIKNAPELAGRVKIDELYKKVAVTFLRSRGEHMVGSVFSKPLSQRARFEASALDNDAADDGYFSNDISITAYVPEAALRAALIGRTGQLWQQQQLVSCAQERALILTSKLYAGVSDFKRIEVDSAVGARTVALDCTKVMQVQAAICEHLSDGGAALVEAVQAVMPPLVPLTSPGATGTGTPATVKQRKPRSAKPTAVQVKYISEHIDSWMVADTNERKSIEADMGDLAEPCSPALAKNYFKGRAKAKRAAAKVAAQ